MEEKLKLPPAYWLASYPKSGNTWVRMFLEAYMNGVVNINRLTATSLSDINLYAYQCVSPVPLNKLDTSAACVMRSAVLAHLLITARSSPRIIKTHHSNCTMYDFPLIPSCMTKAAVYLIRDPRDIVVSFSEHCETSIDECISNMASDTFALISPKTPAPHYLGSWSEHVKSWSIDQPYKILYVRYEQLLQDPETWFAKILETYDIKVNVKKLRKSIKLCEFKKLQAQEKKEGFLEKAKNEVFFKRGNYGGWQTSLTKEQSHRIEREHLAMMVKLKYLDNPVRSIIHGVAS